MNWTDDKIDALFKKAATQQHVEYSPKFWEEIAAQLPIEKQKKIVGWKPFLGLLSLLLLVGTIGTFAYTVWHTPALETRAISHAEEAAPQKIRVGNQLNSNTALSNPLPSASFNEAQVPINNKIVKRAAKEERNTSLLPTNVQSPKLSSNNLISPKNVAEQQEVNERQQTDSASGPNEATSYINTENAKQARLTESNNLPIRPLNLHSAHALLLDTTPYPTQTPIIYSRFRWHAELGGGISQAWTHTPSSSVNASIGLALGLTYSLKNIELSAGIGFQTTRLNQLKVQDRTKIYGFGASLIEQNYQITSISSLTLPLHLNYSFGRHRIELGAVASVNLFMYLRHSQLIDNEQIAYHSTLGNIQLVNKIGLQPTVGYAFRVNETTQLGVRFGVHVIRPIQSNRFIGTPVTLPIEGQFYLRKSLNF